jgi:SAM-dependent methyltransferase
MSATALYNDLSAYYDLMCADIDYRQQSEYVRRIHRLFGNGGLHYLDLACGTGPHLRHFMDFGYSCSGIDLNQPMLDIAQQRCPEAQFVQHDMAGFTIDKPLDLITCFLYSLHYNNDIGKLQQCLASVHDALQEGGVFCFNAVDKNTIDNRDGVRHAIEHDGSRFVFRSGWHYPGHGDRQHLLAAIEKTTNGITETWQDRHAMVAISFAHLQQLMQPWFEVHVFEHVYDRIEPWQGVSGNAIFVGVKKQANVPPFI